MSGFFYPSAELFIRSYHKLSVKQNRPRSVTTKAWVKDRGHPAKHTNTSMTGDRDKQEQLCTGQAQLANPSHRGADNPRYIKSKKVRETH